MQWSTAVLTLVIHFPCQPMGDHRPKDEDKTLIKKITQAVDKKVSIQKVDMFVGRNSNLNTTRPGHRESLMESGVELDPNLSEIKSIKEAKEAAYWVLKAKSDFGDPIIVGIAWTKANNEMKLFFGVIPSP
jgi:hypothetical protein